MAAPPNGIIDLGPASPDEPYDDTRSHRSYPASTRSRSEKADKRDRDQYRDRKDRNRDRDRRHRDYDSDDYDKPRISDRRDRDRDRDRDAYDEEPRLDDRADAASAYAGSTRSRRSNKPRFDGPEHDGERRDGDRDRDSDRPRHKDRDARKHRDEPRDYPPDARDLPRQRDLPLRDEPPVRDYLPDPAVRDLPHDPRDLDVLPPPVDLGTQHNELALRSGGREEAQNELAMSLPRAYYDEPSSTALRRRDHRPRSPTPPRKTTSRKGDILSAVAGAAALTAADKYLIQPRMEAAQKDSRGRARSKSQHEAIRRAADIGIGGIAGTAAYRAISRSRARSKAKKRDDDRGRRNSQDSSSDRSRSRSRSKSVPWKSLLSTAAGGLAGLAAEQVTKNGKKKKEDDRRRRDDYSDDGYSPDRSRNGTRPPNHRRHSSVDSHARGGGRRGRDDYSDDGRSDYGGRDRDGRRRASDPRGPTPNQTRDLMAEALGLLGAAQGLRGKNRGAAAGEMAIGAFGLAQDYYTRHKAAQRAKELSGGAPPRY